MDTPGPDETIAQLFAEFLADQEARFTPMKCCGAQTNRWVIAAAIATLIVGARLSRVIEPGVRVEKVMLTTNTPAIRLFPATPGPHPIARLAHGAMFRWPCTSV